MGRGVEADARLLRRLQRIGFCTRCGDQGCIGDDQRVFADRLFEPAFDARRQSVVERRRRAQFTRLKIDDADEALGRRPEIEQLIGAGRFSVEHARVNALDVSLGRIAVLYIGGNQLGDRLQGRQIFFSQCDQFAALQHTHIELDSGKGCFFRGGRLAQGCGISRAHSAHDVGVDGAKIIDHHGPGELEVAAPGADGVAAAEIIIGGRLHQRAVAVLAAAGVNVENRPIGGARRINPGFAFHAGGRRNADLCAAANGASHHVGKGERAGSLWPRNGLALFSARQLCVQAGRNHAGRIERCDDDLVFILLLALCGRWRVLAFPDDHRLGVIIPIAFSIQRRSEGAAGQANRKHLAAAAHDKGASHSACTQGRHPGAMGCTIVHLKKPKK